jgi:Protein of unknown function (DUF4230)
MLMRNPRHVHSRSILASAVAAVVVVAVIAAALVTGFRMLGNPFTTATRDLSAPPVLLELRDLATFHAAEASFEVTLDVEDDVRWVPSFLAGERVQFVALGTVDAVVDFGSLGQNSVVVDRSTSTVVITLGGARLTAPVLDHEQSHVMNRDRGLVNRIGGMFSDNPTTESQLFTLASAKIAAAAADAGLEERAQHNTTVMLTALVHSLGYETVVVQYHRSSSTA